MKNMADSAANRVISLSILLARAVAGDGGSYLFVGVDYSNTCCCRLR